MNSVNIMGRLTKDPDVRYSAEGKAFGRFSIAVKRRFAKDGENPTDFFDCICFGKTAEFLDKYIQKGRNVAVSGSLRQDSFVDRNGQKRQSVQIVADTIDFADSNKGEASEAKEEPKKQEDWMDIPEGIQEELPFN